MYRASIENRGDSNYHATTRHSSFVLDTEGTGANPVDTLLASLCGCLGHYVRDFMADRQIPHKGFVIAAEAGVTPDRASLDKIHVRIDLKEVTLDDRHVTGILTCLENCKVHKILKDTPGVTISLTGHQAPGD